MVWGFWGDVVLAQRCWWGCKLHSRDIWREDIVVPYVTTYAVTLQRDCKCIQFGNLSAWVKFAFDIF